MRRGCCEEGKEAAGGFYRARTRRDNKMTPLSSHPRGTPRGLGEAPPPPSLLPSNSFFSLQNKKQYSDCRGPTNGRSSTVDRISPSYSPGIFPSGTKGWINPEGARLFSSFFVDFFFTIDVQRLVARALHQPRVRCRPLAAASPPPGLDAIVVQPAERRLGCLRNAACINFD